MRWMISLPVMAIVSVSATLSIGQPVDDQVDRATFHAVAQAESARVQAVKQVYPTVVAVFGKDRKSGGSGVLITPSGLVLTNFHVVQPAGAAGRGGLADGQLYDWDLIGFDPGGDLAMIRLKGRAFDAAALGDSARVRVGDIVMAMGNPFLLAEDLKPTVTMGIVSGIERFQRGVKDNLLVYGNCIQVDSSINPGNSGGPLFDLTGRLIGINGRGSFEERGRVNVGVGYAISAEQFKNFLPALMATRVAEHGTLQATFKTFGADVMCEQVKVDSPIYRAGLRPGHRLISFDGKPIDQANVYNNHLLTLPAGWPVHVRWQDDDDQMHQAWVRLSADAYKQPAPPKPEPEKSIFPKRLLPKIFRQEPDPEVVFKTGRINRPEENRANSQWLLDRWFAHRGSRPADPEQADHALCLLQDVWIDRQLVGRRRVTFCADGRYLVEVTRAYDGLKVGTRFGYDGKHLFVQSPGMGRFADPPVTLAVMDGPMAELFGRWIVAGSKPDSEYLQIDDGDKTAGRRAFRMIGGSQQAPRYLWLSVMDARNEQLEPTVLKLADQIDAPADGRTVVFGKWRRVNGRLVPMDWQVVRGLGEQAVRDYRGVEARWVDPEQLQWPVSDQEVAG